MVDFSSFALVDGAKMWRWPLPCESGPVRESADHNSRASSATPGRPKLSLSGTTMRPAPAERGSLEARRGRRAWAALLMAY
jgi:hypothetical protein